jgi:hypothetical protein
MHPTARERGGEWFVDSQNQVRLGQNAEWSAANSLRMAQKQEYEREQWVRHNWRQDDD